MGSLEYGNETVDVDDRALRHLQVHTPQPRGLNREWPGRLVAGADTVGLRVLPEDPRRTGADLRGDLADEGARLQRPSSAT